ncbi:MAG: hypothetical protein HQK99_12980 [Nitrospirae bacterium]|nr:hypothetical protein [Nitrospirota bacterium]
MNKIFLQKGQKGILCLIMLALVVIIGAGLSYAAQEAASPLVKNPNSTVFFIVGEMHLGKSQKDVAKVVVDLINEYEIDAVFVEQPDELQYNWSAFSELAADKAKAIAVLQNQMLKDADQSTSFDWGIYKKYFENKSLKTDKDLENILREIYKDHGEAGMKDIEKIFKEAKSASGAWKSYKESKTVSAADYLYIMLNLQGIKMPFYNIESKKLRDEFEQYMKSNPDKMAKLDTQKAKNDFECKELQPRDNYMVTTASGVIKNKGYRQIILICGAAHIDCLKDKLSKQGYEVKVSYNAINAMKTQVKLKQIMATLAHPDYIVSLVKNQQGADLKAIESLIALNRPSNQLISSLSGDLKKLGYDAASQEQIKVNFVARYEQEGLKAKTNWSISVPVNKGESLKVSKKSSSEILVVKEDALRPAVATAAAPPPDIAKYFDAAMAAVKRQNERADNKGVLFIHVEKVEKDANTSTYYINDGSGTKEYESAHDFVEKYRTGGQYQYNFFSMGLKPQKLDAFVGEAANASLKDPNNKNTFIALKQISSASELEYFKVKTLRNNTKLTIEDRQLANVKRGGLDGFINRVITLFMEKGQRIKIVISARTADIDQKIRAILLGRPQWDINIGGNLSEEATAALLVKGMDKIISLDPTIAKGSYEIRTQKPFEELTGVKLSLLVPEWRFNA